MTSAAASVARRAAAHPTAPRGSVALRVLAVAAVLVPLAFLGAFFVWPVGAMLARGVTTPTGIDVGGVLHVLARARTQRILGQTAGFALAGTAVSLAAGLPLAHVLYRLRFPGVGVLRGIVVVPFVLPTVVVAVAFRTLLRDDGPLGMLRLDGTATEIVAALAFFNIAVVARTVGAAWAGLDPRREEAARALGAGPWRVLATVTLPRLAPAIGAAAAVVLLFCATAFGVVLVLGGTRYGTVETEIYTLTTSLLDLQGAAALSLVQLVIVALVLAATGLLARRATPERRGAAPRAPRAADVPLLVAAGVVALALLAPLVALVARSLVTSHGIGLDHYLALGGRGTRDALAVPAWQALAHSVELAVPATVIAVVVGACASLVLGRRPRRRATARALRAADALLVLPLGVSAVTVGFGFLITLDHPPLDLRSSPVLVPIAQALVALPLVIRTLEPAVASIDDRMRQAALALGASPLRVLRDVDLAQLRRPLAVATGFAFAVALGEFGATSFLSRPDDITLPVAIARLVSRPGGDDFGMALAASVVLGGLAALAIGAVEAGSAPRGRRTGRGS